MLDALVAITDIVTNFWSMGLRAGDLGPLILNGFRASDGWFVLQVARENHFARLAALVGHPGSSPNGLGGMGGRAMGAQGSAFNGACGGDGSVGEQDDAPAPPVHGDQVMKGSTGAGSCTLKYRSAVEVTVAWVLGVALFAGFAFLVVGFRRNAACLTRKVETLEAQPVVTFSGGMWSRHGGGTRGPWARLQFFDWGIRLDGRSLLPTFEVRYEELTEARLVASRFKSGIRFQSSCLTEPVTFETSESVRIADLLEERGVTVNRNAGHLGWLPGD